MRHATFAELSKSVDEWLDRPSHVLRGLGGTFGFASQELEAWVDRHWPFVRSVGYAFCFVIFVGTVAVTAHNTGLAAGTANLCGRTCLAIPRIVDVTAVAWGGAAVLFTKLYVIPAAALERWRVDTLVYRPAPLTSGGVPTWAVKLYYLTSLVLVGIVIGIAVSISKKHAIDLGEMILGWLVGGRGVLMYFWPPRPGRWNLAFDYAAEAHAADEAELQVSEYHR